MHAGERLALIGENGAGKSTLMNVLYGLCAPDSGEVRVNGASVALRSPRDAMAYGIGMVHQHFMLVPTFTVAENVVLGREPTRRGLLDWDAACAQVKAAAEPFGFTLDPCARVEDLSVGSQQKVEIVKAVHRGAKLLILDEPTAVLTPQERDELFRVTRTFCDRGHSVIFIGHKLEEILGFADRVAVMRRGKLVAQVKAAEASAQSLSALMVGAAPPAAAPLASAAAQGPRTGSEARPMLELDGVHARGRHGLWALNGVTLQVRPGELVGIAGVDGNGQTELAEVITGLRPWEKGTLSLGDLRFSSLTPSVTRAHGVAHIPEDRHARAMVGAMTVEENLALGQQREAPFARGPWVDASGRRARAEELVKRYDVRPPRTDLPMASLSGGNQQKVVLGRELSMAPRLLVAVQPTRGLDVAALTAIHARLLEARDAGAAVLLISLDLDEVLALSDRVYVLASGRVTLELPRGALDERRLGAAMLGTVAHA